MVNRDSLWFAKDERISSNAMQSFKLRARNVRHDTRKGAFVRTSRNGLVDGSICGPEIVEGAFTDGIDVSEL